MRFQVERKEIHVSVLSVEAETPEEAARLVNEGGGTETDCFYQRSLDSDESPYIVKDDEGNELLSWVVPT